MVADCETLVELLGAAKLVAKTRCKFRMDRDRNCVTVAFIKSRKCQHIRVTAEQNGSYTMKFYNDRNWTLTTLAEIENVSPDKFKELITQYTGIEI